MSYLRINHAAVQLWKDILPNPANICLFKVNNRNIRKRPEIGSKLTIMQIKSYNAKSAMKEKKGLDRMSFYKSQELSETFSFN